MALGDRLRTAREARGLSQADLARAVGVSSQAISLVENGTSKGLRPDNLIAVSDALRINPRWLATGKGPMYDRRDNLSPDALAIAESWAALSEDQRDAVKALLDNFLSKNQPARKSNGSKRGD